MPVRLTVAVAEDIGLYMVLAVCVTRWLFNERQPISTFPLSLCERPVSLRPHIDKQSSVGEDIMFSGCPPRSSLVRADIVTTMIGLSSLDETCRELSLVPNCEWT